MAALVGKEFAAGTLERYETSLKHTRSFLEWKFKVPDLDIRKLDFEFIADYEFWLKSVRHCDHNTTMKYPAISAKSSTVASKMDGSHGIHSPALK